MFEDEEVVASEGQKPPAPSNDTVTGTGSDVPVTQAPPTPAPAAPVIDPARYEQLERDHGELTRRYAQMESERQALEMGQSLDRETAEAQQRYEALGLPAEAAQNLALKDRQREEKYLGLRYRATQALHGIDTNLRTGVDVLVRQGVLDQGTAQTVLKVIEASFKHTDSTTAKQAFENDFGKDAKIRTLEARLAKLEKAQVPPQNFEGGQTAAAVSPSFATLMAKDTRGMTPKELAEHGRQVDAALGIRGR